MNSERKPGDQDLSFGVDGVISVGLAKRIGGHIRRLNDGYLIVGVSARPTGAGADVHSKMNVITHRTPHGLEYRAPDTLTTVVTVKLDEEGRLVQSYGEEGYAFVRPFEHPVRLTGSLVLPDGSVLVSLGVFNVDGEAFDSPALLKVDSSGRLDRSFGTDGVYVPAIRYEHSIVWGMALQDDGKILVTAVAIREYNVIRYVLMRINSDGSPDLSFGEDGFAFSLYEGTEGFSGVKVDKQQRIYVAGHVGDNMAVFRFSDDGKPDKDFGKEGAFIYGNGKPRAFISYLSIQDDGIYGVGGFGPLGEQTAGYAKVSFDGVPDQGFNDGTPLEIDLEGSNAGDYVVPLDSGQTIGVGTSFGVDGALTLSMINADGTLDSTFGEKGTVLTNVPGYLLTSIAQEMDNKLLVGGGLLNPRPGEGTSFWISRYLV